MSDQTPFLVTVTYKQWYLSHCGSTSEHETTFPLPEDFDLEQIDKDGNFDEYYATPCMNAMVKKLTTDPTEIIKAKVVLNPLYPIKDLVSKFDISVITVITTSSSNTSNNISNMTQASPEIWDEPCRQANFPIKTFVFDD